MFFFSEDYDDDDESFIRTWASAKRKIRLLNEN